MKNYKKKKEKVVKIKKDKKITQKKLVQPSPQGVQILYYANKKIKGDGRRKRGTNKEVIDLNEILGFEEMKGKKEIFGILVNLVEEELKILRPSLGASPQYETEWELHIKANYTKLKDIRGDVLSSVYLKGLRKTDIRNLASMYVITKKMNPYREAFYDGKTKLQKSSIILRERLKAVYNNTSFHQAIDSMIAKGDYSGAREYIRSIGHNVMEDTWDQFSGVSSHRKKLTVIMKGIMSKVYKEWGL